LAGRGENDITGTITEEEGDQGWAEKSKGGSWKGEFDPRMLYEKVIIKPIIVYD
jgi:hypothetical protein